MSYDKQLIEGLKKAMFEESSPEKTKLYSQTASRLEYLAEELRLATKLRIYGIRVHERVTEEDPSVGTVMFSSSGSSGPWVDMATGNLDWCWDILDALECSEYLRGIDVQKSKTETALMYVIGILSTYPEYSDKTPDEIRAIIMEKTDDIME